MHPPETTTPVPPRRRWRRWIVVGLLLVACFAGRRWWRAQLSDVEWDLVGVWESEAHVNSGLSDGQPSAWILQPDRTLVSLQAGPNHFIQRYTWRADADTFSIGLPPSASIMIRAAVLFESVQGRWNARRRGTDWQSPRELKIVRDSADRLALVRHDRHTLHFTRITDPEAAEVWLRMDRQSRAGLDAIEMGRP